MEPLVQMGDLPCPMELKFICHSSVCIESQYYTTSDVEVNENGVTEVSLLIKPDENIETLRNNLARVIGIPPQEQHICFAGYALPSIAEIHISLMEGHAVPSLIQFAPKLKRCNYIGTLSPPVEALRIEHIKEAFNVQVEVLKEGDHEASVEEFEQLREILVRFINAKTKGKKGGDLQSKGNIDAALAHYVASVSELEGRDGRFSLVGLRDSTGLKARELAGRYRERIRDICAQHNRPEPDFFQYEGLCQNNRGRRGRGSNGWCEC